MKNSERAFLALVQSGLWETNAELAHYGEFDYSDVLKKAEEQSVVGLVTAGLEKVVDVKVPQEVILQFIGSTLQIEQRNKEQNDFIVKLVKKLSAVNVYSLLVKGQGVAQCYEKPLWRACGDVDLLMDSDNYEKAKKELFPIAYDIQFEEIGKKHQALKILGVDVELHGHMPFALSEKADHVIDEVISDSLNKGGICVWKVENVDVFLPKPDNHLFLVFTHYLHHFFIEGVGLRQICDWCRMLYRYQKNLNLLLLESRIRKAGLMTEWQVFGALAVEYLGMLKDAMPFYDSRFTVKGSRVLKRVLKTGNFGHNNDLSYRTKYSGVKYKVVATWRRFWDFATLIPVFPLDAPKFFVKYIFGKV